MCPRVCSDSLQSVGALDTLENLEELERHSGIFCISMGFLQGMGNGYGKGACMEIREA